MESEKSANLNLFLANVHDSMDYDSVASEKPAIGKLSEKHTLHF